MVTQSDEVQALKSEKDFFYFFCHVETNNNKQCVFDTKRPRAVKKQTKRIECILISQVRGFFYCISNQHDPLVPFQIFYCSSVGVLHRVSEQHIFYRGKYIHKFPWR